MLVVWQFDFAKYLMGKFQVLSHVTGEIVESNFWSEKYLKNFPGNLEIGMKARILN
jgi:hypothetical protein